MFAEFYSLILAIAEQIHEASYYVMLISSLGFAPGPQSANQLFIRSIRFMQVEPP